MSPSLPLSRARRLAGFALLVLTLAVVAAVLSFVRGSWLGVVWILMAGVVSNMAWYYLRRAQRPERPGAAATD